MLHLADIELPAHLSAYIYGASWVLTFVLTLAVYFCDEMSTVLVLLSALLLLATSLLDDRDRTRILRAVVLLSAMCIMSKPNSPTRLEICFKLPTLNGSRSESLCYGFEIRRPTPFRLPSNSTSNGSSSSSSLPSDSTTGTPPPTREPGRALIIERKRPYEDLMIDLIDNVEIHSAGESDPKRYEENDDE